MDPKAERFSGEISIDLHLTSATQILWLHARHLDFDRAEVSAGGKTVKAAATPAGEDYVGVALQSKDSEERETVFAAMGHFRAPQLVQRSLEPMLSGKIDIREAAGPFIFGPLDQPEGRDVSYAFVKAHFDELLAKMPSFEADALLYPGQKYCDPAHRRDVVSFFTPKAQQITGGVKELAHVVEMIDSCIAIRERQQASAAAFLQRY